MKERPIIMSAESVQAILDGRKTQTRRVVKPQPIWIADPNIPFKTFDCNPKGIIKNPYGKKGDRLWVKENFTPSQTTGYIEDDYTVYIKYQDGKSNWFDPDELPEDWSFDKSNLHSSIYMPRWASRITLEITNIRVERLQDITEDDAIAEGCYITDNDLISCCNYDCSKHKYQLLWDKLNAKRGYSWESNPFVWVIEFRRVEE